MHLQGGFQSAFWSLVSMATLSPSDYKAGIIRISLENPDISHRDEHEEPNDLIYTQTNAKKHNRANNPTKSRMPVMHIEHVTITRSLLEKM